MPHSHTGWRSGAWRCLRAFRVGLAFLPAPLLAASPVANFSVDAPDGPWPHVVNFTDLSTDSAGPITAWAWGFGDGATDSINQNPTHTYADSGTYTVALTVRGPSGLDDTTMVDLIHVTEPPPVAAFSASPTSGDYPLPVNFTDLSTGGAITSWAWSFGDGDSSFVQSPPTHTYADTGSYDVSLTVTGPGGADTETKAGYIHVTEPPPVANFSASPDSGDRPLTVSFTNQTSGGRDTSWTWTFGDGGVSSLENPSHPYTISGLFDVSLTVTGPGGTDDTTMVDRIRVTEPLIADFFAFPTSGLPGDSIQFFDQSTGEAGEPSGWLWDFGDTQTSVQQNPKHAYASAGTYSVTLTVTGNGGRTDDSTRVDYITISENAPVAGFGGTPGSGVVPLTVTFTDSSTGVIDTWLWNFGDGGGSGAQNPVHPYTSAGIYTVSLQVSGPGGSDTDTKPNYITVYDSLNADFTAFPASGPRPLFVQFTDNSTPVGEIDTWHWFFGDGGESFARNPGYTYNDVGTYDVTLIVTGPAGADTTTKAGFIDVTYPAPVADFSGTPLSGPAPLDVSFTDLSTDSVDSWLWNFGDSGTDNVQNPVHRYTAVGQYNVRLDVSGPGGTDFERKTNYITVNPGAPDTILVSGIADPVTAGTPASVTVEIKDAFGNRVTDYAGTVQFATDDPGSVTLPPDYTFLPATDQGIHTFTNGVTLVTAGDWTVQAVDTADPGLRGRQAGITVTPADPASVVLTPAGPINITVDASVVFTAEVTDAWTNAVEGQRIDVFIKDVADGTLGANPADPNPTFPNGSDARWGFSDADGRITLVYNAPSQAGLTDLLDAMAQPYVDSLDVADVTIRSVASGATKLVVLPVEPITTTANTPFDLTIEAQDSFGNLDPMNTSTVLLSSDSPTLEYSEDGFGSTITQIVLSGGRSSGLQARDPTTGMPEARAADQAGLLDPGVKSNITIDPGPADHIVLSGIPPTITAGDPQTVTVEVKDTYDNRKTDYLGTVTFLSSDMDDDVVLPPDHAFDGGDAGIHTFNGGVILVTANTGHFVLARDVSAPNVNGSITQIEVVPAGADSFAITGIPDSLEAGVSAPFTLTALDPWQNTATGYLGTVRFQSDDPGADVVLPGNYAFQPADQGVRAFSPGVTLVTAGSRKVEALDVVQPTIRGSRSGIEVVHTTVDSLLLTGLPPGVTAGQHRDLTTEAIDRFGNRVLDYDGTVHFSSNDEQASLPDPYGFLSFDQGRHTFVNGVTFRTAGTRTVAAVDSVASVTGESAPVTVDHTAPATLVLTPPDTVYVTVEAGQVFTAAVRDTFANLVDQEGVSIVLAAPNRGALHDDPDNPNDTSGFDRFQQGTTDTTGTVTVLYTAPPDADLFDDMDAWSDFIDSSLVDNVTIRSVASGATKLVILPTGPIQSTANLPFALTIEAQDNNENRDPGDTTRVGLGSDSGTMRFSVDNFKTTVETIRLAGGRSQNLLAKDTATGTPSITVQDADSIGLHLAPDTKANITIVPAAPYGPIVLSFTGRDTLTADGSSTTTLLSEAIRDSLGNSVEAGVDVTVEAGTGSITSPDVNDGVPGIQVRTDAAGTISFGYRVGSVAGPDTIRATTVTGSATGFAVAILQAPPALSYRAATLNPNTVSPGTAAAFELVLGNDGEAGISLHDSSTFNFGDGQTLFTTMLSQTFFVDAAGLDTIHFRTDTIPEAMPEGTYTPTLDLYGTDTNGAPYHRVVIVADGDRLHVSSLVLNAVVAFGDTVSLGDSVEVQMEVKNLGGIPVTIEEGGLIFSPADGQFDVDLRNLPLTVPPNGTRNIDGSVRIGEITPPGEYQIDGFVVGSSGGGAVSDSSANIKDSWFVISAALAEYVPGSLTPTALSAAGAYVFRLDLVNAGAARVTLSRGTTRLELGTAGALADVSIPEDRVMPGDSATTSIFFNTASISDTIPPGTYPVTLHLNGRTELGGAFHQIIELPDSARVEPPPETGVVAASLSKHDLSAGYTEVLFLRVGNSGGAALDLDAEGTVLFFGSEDTLFTARLNGQGTTHVVPGADTTLMFLPAPVPGTLASGAYATRLLLSGSYNGVAFADTALGDTVRVEAPATLRVDVIAFPERVAQGESFPITAGVGNEGEAGVTGGGLLFLDADSLSIEDAVLPFGPHLPDTLTWTVTAPAGLRPGVAQLSASISQVPRDENSGQNAFIGQGVDNFALTVVRRNQLALGRIDGTGFPPENVYRGQSDVPMLPLLARSEGEKEGDIRLDAIRVGVEERGGVAITEPGRVLDRIYLTGAGGSVLAEAVEPVQGKFLLVLGDEYRIGGDPDTLRLYVDVSAGAEGETFQLMIDGADAVDAVDLATGSETGVVEGGGGDPLGALRSGFTVLNQEDFAASFKNYPNPMGRADGSTTFSYFLPDDADVTVTIYTLTGSRVKELTFPAGSSGGRGPGINQVRWGGFNGKGRYVNNGVYFCVAIARTRAGEVYSTRHKLAVMR